MAKTNKTTSGKGDVRDSKSGQQGGVATLLPPGSTSAAGGQPQGDEAEKSSDIGTVLSRFDEHVEADKKALGTALEQIEAQQGQADEDYKKKSESNAQQRQAILARMAILTGKPTGEKPVNRVGRPLGSKNKPKASAATVGRGRVVGHAKADKAAGRKRAGGQRDTDRVLIVLQKMGGKHTNAEIAEAVLAKHEDMDRKRIDAALQSLRGRMVDGKQQSATRVRVTGKARAYKYQAIV